MNHENNKIDTIKIITTIAKVTFGSFSRKKSDCMFLFYKSSIVLLLLATSTPPSTPPSTLYKELIYHRIVLHTLTESALYAYFQEDHKLVY